MGQRRMQDSRTRRFRLGAARTFPLPPVFDSSPLTQPRARLVQKCVHAFQPLGPENEFIGIISPGSWTK